jgi:hypothetical protein
MSKDENNNLLARKPESFSDRDMLRFLYGYEFKISTTIKAIQDHFDWQINYLPCKLTQNAVKLIVREFYKNYFILDFECFYF